MPKINILDSSVYNLISAGEVVERPASIVKELVENSIDAGATEIDISLTDGGLTSIVVADNGVGIDSDDLAICYLPHTTSKIKEAADLDDISTLGFRGEALASITAVSQVNISTKTTNNAVGEYIQIDGGKLVDKGQIGAKQGTKIQVENIFFNTPVRRKFLKKPKQEESIVSSVVTELIFANPDIKFTYTSDDKVVFQTNGGLENAIYAIYSTDIANKMIAFDDTYDGIRVYGYTGDKTLSKHNRSFQTIIVNGRTITNTTIQTAVIQAYGNILMKRCYPVYILNIIMPFEDVDVNVHPNKKEVRFADNQRIFSRVYHTISKALATQSSNMVIGQYNTEQYNNNQNNSIENVVFAEKNQQDCQYFSTNTNVDNSNNQVKLQHNDVADIMESFSQNNDNLEINDPKLRQAIEAQENLIGNITKSSSSFADRKSFDKLSDNLSMHSPIASNKYDYTQSSLFEQIEQALAPEYKIVGQLFDTYLILELADKAFIIDQHACHERILYDQLLEKIDQSQVARQPMLIPHIIECNNAQYEYMNSILDYLTSFGFDIQEFGGLSFKVDSIPSLLSDINLDKFFDDILNEKNFTASLKKSDLIKDRLAQLACKSAIKSGDKLNDAQIRSLVDNMNKGIPMQCPHGRPTVVELTRTQLDKLFKRIV